jgi:hypothetical protein
MDLTSSVRFAKKLFYDRNAKYGKDDSPSESFDAARPLTHTECDTFPPNMQLRAFCRENLPETPSALFLISCIVPKQKR